MKNIFPNLDNKKSKKIKKFHDPRVRGYELRKDNKMTSKKQALADKVFELKGKVITDEDVKSLLEGVQNIEVSSKPVKKPKLTEAQKAAKPDEYIFNPKPTIEEPQKGNWVLKDSTEGRKLMKANIKKYQEYVEQANDHTLSNSQLRMLFKEIKLLYSSLGGLE